MVTFKRQLQCPTHMFLLSVWFFSRERGSMGLDWQNKFNGISMCVSFTEYTSRWWDGTRTLRGELHVFERCLYSIPFPVSVGLGLPVWQGEEGPQAAEPRWPLPVTCREDVPGTDPAFRQLGEMGRRVTSQEPGRGGGRSTCPLFPLPQHRPLFVLHDFEPSLSPGGDNASLFGA